MKGYTFIELILVLSIFSFIMLSVYRLSFDVAQTTIKLTQRSDSLQDARLALDFIAEEISLCSHYGIKKRDYIGSYSDAETGIFEGVFEGLKLKLTPEATHVTVFYYKLMGDATTTGDLYYGGGTNYSTTAQLLVEGITSLTLSADPNTKILTLTMVKDDITLVKKISLRYKKSGSYTAL